MSVLLSLHNRPTAATADPELVRRSLDGEPEAWDALIQKHARLVYAVPFRYGLAEAEADEVFHRVWEQALQGLEGLKDVPRLSSWLITAASRESWRLVRERPREPGGIEGAEGAPQRQEDFSLLAAALRELESQHLVRRAVERLRGACRQLLWHLYYDPQAPSYTTVADRLGMPAETIGPQRARCLRRLGLVTASMGVAYDTS